MTAPLFPDARERGTVASIDHSGPHGRWYLHRAGLLNVWQYDRVELHFAGGRLLLRGKNGAGKSKALEVLLPFLLDGDTRQLDATGRDRTTVAWLMTDARPPGNHVGYVWLELRCVDHDGSEAFQTLGAGLKASTATRKADAWFFITERRVGVDVDLDVAGECLSIERLKAVLGDDAVTASGAEHRRRVGRHVFGLFDEARYRNLLHLLHRLRDPNIGNRVEAGELANVLSDALPPIDERVLAEAAGHFDDLDAIREQVERASRTAVALGEFLGAYRGYTRTVLSRRAQAVLDADAERARVVRETERLERGVADAAAAVDAAHAALEGCRRERSKREAERRELERSEGYRAHQDLVDRDARVVALGETSRIAAGAAARAEDVHRRAVGELDGATADLRRSLGETGKAATLVAAAATDAGLDPVLLGPDPATGVDGGMDDAEVVAADERSRAARQLADARHARASELQQMAQRAERAEGVAVDAEERTAVSEADVDQQRAAVAVARSARDDAEHAWADAVAAWTATGVPASLDVRWDATLGRLAARDGEPSWTAAVRQAVADAIAPALQVARHDAAAADVAVARAEEALAAVRARLHELEAQTEARPPVPRYRGAERHPAAGAPFYELVDIGPQLSPAEAAGLEAALESSGLLDAWVSADGVVVHPDTNDVMVRVGTDPRLAGEPTLADLLVPARPDGCPVSRETIVAVLSAIGAGPRADATTWLSTAGRWSLGVLRGAWRKDEVEYLGAAARRATRERLLAELRVEADTCEADGRRARSDAANAATQRDRVESLPASLPSAEAIDAAVNDLRGAERDLAAARARFEVDRRRADEARAAANRLATEVADKALAESLPTGVADLDRVLAALADLRHAVVEHRQALRELRRANDRLRRCRDDEATRQEELVAAVAEAHLRRDEHDTATHELATLRKALATTVEAVLAQHREATARLAALDETLIPAAEQGQRDADIRHAEVTTELTAARDAEAHAAASVTTAGESLAAAVALPGVLLAATGRDVDHVDELVPDERETLPGSAAFAAALLPEVDGSDDVSDGVILSRYDRLSDALAGGYDTAIDEDDGVKVVHVADDTGRQPLAVVAVRVADEADMARGRLAAREREVLERFLLRELADEARAKLLDAHDLVTATNRTLAGVHTSHGKGAHLDWTLRDDAAAPAATAARLLVDALRDEAADAQLRDALLALIEAERAVDPTAGYEQHLRAALDYRAWYRFAVKVTDAANPGTSRILSSRLGLSQGEQRVISYLALFAAASSHFEAIARETPTAPRLLLLDDAFAKVDEPTHAELLGLLVDLGLDFVLTSERMWGCFPSVPTLEIYEAVRDPAHPGVALVHFRWDGRQRHLVGM